MANYNSVAEIVASVDNATQLRINTKQGDGTDTVTGVDWFSYLGTICNKIYVNGNSWIGLGKSQEDLKVNRRDGAMWNLWREEGTIGNIKFLRIRWGGYSNYNTTEDAWKLTYDVILFDTGDIQLYMVDIPTQNYTGTFSLGSTSYTAPTNDSRYVAFCIAGDSYDVKYEQLSFYTYKYLVRDNGTIYTVANNALSEVQGSLSAELFNTYGIDAPPDGALLIPLSAPDVLCWTDAPNAPQITATVQGTPTGSHDIVSDKIPVGHTTIYGVLSTAATASDTAEIYVSFDGGGWMIYTDSNTWAVSDFGMTPAQFLAVPMSAWDSVIADAEYMQLRVTLSGADTVTQIYYKFNNVSPVTQSGESEV